MFRSRASTDALWHRPTFLDNGKSSMQEIDFKICINKKTEEAAQSSVTVSSVCLSVCSVNVWLDGSLG